MLDDFCNFAILALFGWYYARLSGHLNKTNCKDLEVLLQLIFSAVLTTTALLTGEVQNTFKGMHN